MKIQMFALSAILLTQVLPGAEAANTGVRFANGVSVGTVAGTMSELSGCAASRVNSGVFWMHNDSGDSARIYAVNRNGASKGTYTLSGAAASDWEDIAVGPGPVAGKSYIYVGDIGDNGASRNTKQVYRVAEPTIGSGSTTLAAEKFNLVYPDGKRDAETLMVDPRTSDLYVVSKREDSNRVYRFKAPLVNGGSYTGVEVARIPIYWLTGGDISADGSRILIRTTSQVYLWLRKDGETVGAALSRTPIKLPTVSEPQGEAVCWDRSGTDYYTISEHLHQPFNYYRSLDTALSPSNTNSLQTGATLATGKRLASANGLYHFDVQGDGNLAVTSASGQLVWAAHTAGKGGNALVLQDDGDLVLRNAHGRAVWHSATDGTAASHLIITDDGSLALLNQTGDVVWTSQSQQGISIDSSNPMEYGDSVPPAFAPTLATAALVPRRYDHVVVVLMENESATSIFGSSSTPYIHSLASQGVRFTQSHAVTHPSEPNYLALFSGSTQGIKDDSCPNNFSGKNLGSQLIAAGFSFKGYSESMPSNGYTGCSSNGYVRKHNPWVMFSTVPASSNLTFAAFPASSNYSSLPTVSFVVPNQCNNMHDCSLATGDAWLKKNIDAYAQWAKTHNSLLILTWDEDEGNHNNLIPTVFVGAGIKPGTTNSQSFSHYGLLRTLEDMYGLTPLNNAAAAAPISGW
jgi:acid phosphatase